MTDQHTDLPPLHESWLPKEHALYRPRHGGRQRLALVCAAVFFALPLISLGLGLRPTEFENRHLTGFPSPSQGWSFFGQLAPWATDHLPFRQRVISFGTWMSQGLFGELPSYGGNAPQVTPGPIGPLPGATYPGPTPTQINLPTVLPGQDGWLYLGYELASHCDQGLPTNTIVADLRKLRDGVMASGRKFVLVIAPDKATIVPQYLPVDFPGKACHSAVTTQFWQAMAAENYVLDLRAELTAWGQQLGAPVYGPQDAHWSDEGGVIMTRRLADQLQPGISAPWKIVQGQTWEESADLPALIGRTGITTGRHYSILPDGKHNQTYAVPTDYNLAPRFYNSTFGPGTYSPGVGLLADSFTIRAAPYLASVFGNLTITQTTDVDHDHGVTVARSLVPDTAVVVEVAERTLVTGRFDLLDPVVQDNIIRELAAHPIR
jgi:alginate O-acetyltransferase complex protein AlgJ